MALRPEDEKHLSRAIELARLARANGNHPFEGATLYASTEPSGMCSGAIYWAGIGRVVYALGSEELAAMVKDVPGTSTLTLLCREVLARDGREVDVSGPHLADEAAAVHQGFWS